MFSRGGEESWERITAGRQRYQIGWEMNGAVFDYMVSRYRPYRNKRLYRYRFTSVIGSRYILSNQTPPKMHMSHETIEDIIIIFVNEQRN